MPNMLRRVASEAPTLSPALINFTSFKISMVPLEILVGMDRAWKKEVFSGPRPVLRAVTVTSRGAMAPALAGAATLFSWMVVRTSVRSPLVNTNPTLPRMWGSSFSRAGLFSKWVRMGAHHGVLAHENDCRATEGNADVLHLLGAHIVHSNKEASWVLIQQFNDLQEVICLPG